MPGPSERNSRERIEDAFTAVAEEIVKRRESLRAKGKSGSSFRVRIAPTMADYRKGRCGCGGYDPRDADSRDVFFAVVSELEKTCGVEVRRDATGAPESLVANESVVRYAYRKTGRNFDETEERASLAALLSETAHACSGVPWARAWTERIVSETACAVCSSRLRERSAAGDLEDVCAALKAYAAQDFRGLRRVLSTAAYGDSKYFEKAVSASFVKAAKLGGFDFGPALDMENKLAALGFRREKHRCVAIGGNAIVRPSWGIIDLSQVGCDGVMLSLPAVEGFTDSSFIEAKGCVVVENLTVFRALCLDSTKGLFVVWGHGRPNEAVRRLVEILDAALPGDAPFLVWSDVDLGGFDIAESLMSMSDRMRPVMMGKEELRAVDASRLLRRSEAYWMDVRRFIARHPDSCFRDVAQACLELRGTLEQEALLFEYAQEKIKGIFDA